MTRRSVPVAAARPAAFGRGRALRPAIILAVLAASLVAAIVVATALGAVALPFGDTFRIVLGKLTGAAWVDDSPSTSIIWSVRLPRVVMAGLVGFALGSTGAAMQGLFRNPMASPDVVGLSAGASAGAVAAIFLGQQAVSPWSVPFAAFAGGLVATLLVYALSTQRGRTDTATLLLAGMAVSSLCSAAISLVYHFVDDGLLRQAVFWLMGNLRGKTWEHVAVVSPFVLLGFVALWAYARDLNMMLGGDEDAKSLGVPVERVRFHVLILVALAAGASVSAVGMIGFIGLIVPHTLRPLMGPDHRWLLPASGIGGATLLILADLVGRIIFSPVELRPGIVTAFLGVPFFLYLVVRRREMVRWN